MRLGDNLVLRAKLQEVREAVEAQAVAEMKLKHPNTPDHVLRNVLRAQKKFAKVEK